MLEAIAEGVFGVGGQQRLPGGVVFPLRMTVVMLPDGALWLHSPVPLDDSTAAAVEALGPVRHIVAPSRMHHLHVGAAKARWPKATVFGVTGLPGTVDETLSDGPPAAWQGAIDLVPIRGPQVWMRPSSSTGRRAR